VSFWIFNFFISVEMMSSQNIHLTSRSFKSTHGGSGLFVEEGLGWVLLQGLLFDPLEILGGTTGEWHDD